MPRRNLPPVAVAPVAALVAPPPPSPLIITLRKDWRWAAISQFIWTFSDAFGLIDWDIEVSLVLLSLPRPAGLRAATLANAPHKVIMIGERSFGGCPERPE